MPTMHNALKRLRFLAVSAAALVLSACTNADQVKVQLSSTQNIVLSGKFDGYGTSSLGTSEKSSLTALACSAPTVSLYRLSDSGDRVEPAVAVSALTASGNYSFDVRKLKIAAQTNRLLDPHVLVIFDCGDAVYMRPVTAIQKQNITAASSVVSYLLNTSPALKQKLVEVLKKNPQKIASLIEPISATSLPDAYDKILNNSALSAEFQSLIGALPSVLPDASPEIRTVTLPATASEMTPLTLNAGASHWFTTYPLTYEWLLDSTTIATSANPTFIPSGNSQGVHTLTLRVGKDNGSGHVDTTAYYKEHTGSIAITNNVLPQPPQFTISSPAVSGSIPISSRNLTVRLQTGASQIHCQTFSKLLLTESAIQPDPADSFPITCSQNVTQDLSFNVTSSGDGLKTLHLWALDAAGVVSAASETVNFNLDTQAPTITIANVPALSNQSTQTITFAGSDAGGTIDHFECKLDSASWAACSSPVSLSGLAEGNHTFSARVFDTATNVSAIATATWLVDLTQPVLTVSSTPSALTNSLVSSFTFTATDFGGSGVSSFICSLDNAASAACTSPVMSTLIAGSHSMKIQALDAAGNLSTLFTHTWTIDTTAPVTTITSKPASVTNSQTPNFAFAATDTGGGAVQGYECQLDGGSFSACTSPKSYSGVSSAAHTFKVRATDTAGNIGTAASYTWTIDTTTPMASITSQPNSITNLTTASFSFSATAPPAGSITGYQCLLDSGSYAACTSPVSYTGLTQQSHSFSVRSIDNNGGLSTPTSFTWSVDLTAPVVTVSSQPANPTSATSGTFAFSATDTGGGSVASYECKLDSGSYTSCSSPKTFPTLAEGSHTVLIRALDTAGNISAVQTSTWIVDTTVPSVTISTKPAAITNATTASFSFSATDTSAISGYSCSVDAAAYASCASPLALSSIAAGSHTFSVKATDAAGNVSSVSSYSWTVDVTAPAVTVTAGPPTVTNQTTASITFTATDTGGGSIASTTCSLDGAAFSACTSPASYSGLSASSHTLQIKATDTAGNISTAASNTWTIDTTAPVVAITTPGTNGTVAPASSLSSYLVSGTCSESGIAVSIAGSITTSATCSSGTWSATLNLTGLADGAVSIQASQVDVAGNTSAIAARSLVKDTVLPVLTLTSIPALRGGTANTFGWTLTDLNIAASTNFTLELYDGSTWGTIGSAAATAGVNSSTSYSVSSSALPSVNIANAQWRVSITDAAGNSTTQTSAAIRIDSTLPTLSSFQLAAGATSVALPYVAFALSANDTGSGLAYMRFSEAAAFADDSWQPYTSAGTLTLSMVSGTKTVYVWVKDLAGNVSSTPLSTTITLDYGTPPVLAITSPVDANISYTTGSVVPIAWTCTSSQPLDTNPIAYIKYTVDDGNSFTTIISDYQNNDSATSGHYDWSLPSALNGQVFRIAVGCRSVAGVITNATGKALNTGGAWEIWAGGLFPIRDNITALGAGNLNILFGTTTLAVDNNNNVFFTAGNRATSTTNVSVLMRVDAQTGKLTRVAGSYFTMADDGDLSGTDITTKRLCNNAVILGISADHKELLFHNCNRIYGYDTASKVVRLFANITAQPITVSNAYYTRSWYFTKSRKLIYWSSQKLFTLDLNSTGNSPVWIFGDGSVATNLVVGTEGKLSPAKSSNTDATPVLHDVSLVANADGTKVWFGGTFTSAPSTGTNTWAQIDYDAATQKYFVTSDTFTTTARALSRCIAAEHDNYSYCMGRDSTQNIHRFDPASGTVSANFKNITYTTSLNSSGYAALAATPTALYLANNSNVIGVLSSDLGTLSIIAGVKNHFVGEGLSKNQADFVNLYDFDYSPVSKYLVLKQDGNARLYNYNLGTPVIYSTTSNFSGTLSGSLSVSHSGTFLLQTENFARIARLGFSNISTAATSGSTNITSGLTSPSATYDYAANHGIPDGTVANNTTSGAASYLLGGSTGKAVNITLAHSTGDAYLVGSQSGGSDLMLFRVKVADGKVYKVAGTSGAPAYAATGAGGTLATSTALKAVNMMQEISTGTYAGDLLILDERVLRRISVATEPSAPRVYDIVSLDLATGYSTSTAFQDVFYDETSQDTGLGGTLGTGNLYYSRTSPSQTIRKWKASSDLMTATDTAYSLPGLTLSGTYKVVRTPDGLLVIEVAKSRILRLPP